MFVSNSIYVSEAKTSLERTKARSALVMGKDSAKFSTLQNQRINHPYIGK